MSRETKILLSCLLGGGALLCLAGGQWFFETVFGESDYEHKGAQQFFGFVGVSLLVATFVLREVFRKRQK